MIEFPEDEAIKYFREGIKFARANKLDLAIDSFKKAVEIDSELIKGWNNLGLAYLQSNQPKKAIESYDKAIDLEPDNYETLKMKAHALILIDKYEGAIGVLNKILERNPEEAEALFEKALALLKLNKLNEALITLDKAAFYDPYMERADKLRGGIVGAIGINKQQDKSLVDIVRDLKSKGKFKEAHKEIDKFLKKNTNAEMFKEKGDIYFDEGQYNRAIKFYDKSIELNPYNLGAFHNKGSAYLEQGKLKNALIYFTEAVRIKPSSQQVRKNRNEVVKRINIEKRGTHENEYIKNRSDEFFKEISTAISFKEAGQFKKAMEKIDQMLADNSGHNEILSLKAELLRKMGRFEESIQILDQIIKQKPKLRDLLIDVYENKGISLKNLGRYEEALECYDQVIKLNPELTTIYTNKGNIFMELNRMEESLAMHQKAIKLDPIGELGWNNLGVSQNIMKRYDDALKSFNEALRLNNKFYQSYWGKGMVLKKLGRYEESIKCFDEALNIEEALPSVWYFRGSSLFYLGAYKESYLSYRQALEMDPSYSKGKHEKMRIILNQFKDKNEISPFERMPLNGFRVQKLLKKADSFSDLQRYEDALNFYNLAINCWVLPALAKSWSGKAFCLGMLERYDEALEAYDMAIRQDDSVITFLAILNKANLLVKLKRFTAALEMYDKALEKGDNPAALQGKASTLIHLKEYRKAKIVAARLTEMEPNNAEAWFIHGVSLANLGKIDKAMTSFAHATRINPKYMDIVKKMLV